MNLIRLAAATLLVLLCSCMSPPAEPDPMPPPVHAYAVTQVLRNGHSAYAVCADCPRPTRKTLPGSRRLALAPPPAASAPSSAVLPLRSATKAARPLVATLQFELNSAELSPAARKQLELLTPLLRHASKVQVTGYTDAVGSLALNTRLSDARALAVVLALRELLEGADDTTLINRPVLAGSGRPQCCYVSDNGSAPTRQANRRAELVITIADGQDLEPLIAALRRGASLRNLPLSPAPISAPITSAAEPVPMAGVNEPPAAVQ